MITTIQPSIGLVHESRTSMISVAVTGKIDASSEVKE